MGALIIAAATIAIIIPASLWTGGLSAIYTRYERIEIKNAYVLNSGGNYVVTIEYVNTGTTSTSIDYILMNGITPSSYAPAPFFGSSFASLPSVCELGISKTGMIILKLGASYLSRDILKAGLTLIITLHTTGGRNYLASLTLPDESKIDQIIQENSSAILKNTNSSNEITMSTLATLETNNITRISAPINDIDDFVHSKNGRFYNSSNFDIIFFGAYYYHAFLKDTKESAANPSEEDFQDLASKGFNLIRIPIVWRFLESTYLEVGNFSYMTRVNQMLDWAEKYHIYVLVDIHPMGLNTLPLWIKSMDDMWNVTVRVELGKLWSYLAAQMQNRTIILGYDLPWNEPDLSVSLARKYIKLTWNTWLQKRYVTIDYLNNTWKNAGNSYLHNDESIWGNIRLPAAIDGWDGGWYDCRLNDWYLFAHEYLSNYTDYLIDQIKASDTNHLIFYQSMNHIAGFEDLKAIIPPTNLIPYRVDALTPHMYLDNENYLGDNDQTRISSFPSSYISMWRTVTQGNMPIIIGEFGVRWGNTNKADWVKAYLSQMWNQGVKGIIAYDYHKQNNTNANSYDIIWSNLEYRPDWEPLNNFSVVYKQKTRDFRSKVLIVYPLQLHKQREVRNRYEGSSYRAERVSRQYSAL